MNATTTNRNPTSAGRTSYRCGSLPIKQATALPRHAVAAGGPVPKLLRSGRWPLAVWLLLVAAASPGPAMVELGFYRNFASRSLGLRGNPSSIRSTITRTLERLAALKLITVEEKSHGHVTVKLLALDGTGRPYVMPRHEQTRIVRVPTGPLFANGWHKKLSPVELAGLLIALTEESWQFNKVGPRQWEKTRKKIAADYGLATSTWSKAKDGLLACGLLEWDLSPLPAGSPPEAVPMDRYTVHTDPLDLDPELAPRYEALTAPVTVTAPSGRKFRLHSQARVEIPAAAKVVHLRRSGRSA
jgi:hypothetical protein